MYRLYTSLVNRVRRSSISACSWNISNRRLQPNALVAYCSAAEWLPRCSSSKANRANRVAIFLLLPNSLKKLRH
jgi:hypothetical protein